MGLYDAFREYGLPTLYASNKTPVTVDVLEAGLIFSTVILAFSLLIVIPGYHGKEIVTSTIKILLGVFITCAIMLCNFGQEWEVAHTTVTTQYRAGIVEEITADVGVKIGLRSVNITLKTDPEVVEFAGELNETINYNERFSWNNLAFTQGRAGFGPFAGRFNQEFREAQLRGLPYPILWVAEYFTIDGEGIRWGRFYRQAGYYTHICLWLAFPLWLLSMILMHMVIRYGGYFSILTGLTLFLGNITFATIRNRNELYIPFNEHSNLEFTFGWCFILNLFTAILCTIIGIIISIMDLRAYEKLASFFGVDVLQDYEEIYVDNDELDVVVRAGAPAQKKTMKQIRQNGSSANADEEDSDYEDTENLPTRPVRQFRKRSTAFTKKIQKSRRRIHKPSANEMEMSGPAKKYHLGSTTDSIAEEEVFDETYENTGKNRSKAMGQRRGYNKMIKK